MPILGTCAVFAIFGAASWPISFEHAGDLSRFRPGGVTTFERAQERATDGQWSLHVIFPGSSRDTWPGFWLPLEGQPVTGDTSLLFDVFNPAAQATSVSWRIDDADGHKVFGSRSLPAGRVTTVQIWFAAFKYILNIDHLRGVYIYARKPRTDRELFFDNFRLQHTPPAFKEVVHLPHTQPHPSAERPLITFQRHWLEHVFPDDWPADDEVVHAVRVSAARGEYEPLTVSIAAGADLTAVRLKVTDLRGPEDFPSSAIGVRVVRALDKRWTYHDRQRRIILRLPVLLEPLPPQGLAVSAGRVVRFWITIHVPPRQPPGLYTGRIVVSAQSPAGEFEQPLQLRLRVYPFSLPEPEDMFWSVYYTGPSPFETGDDLEKLERHIRDMRAHGMTSVGLCFGWEGAQTDLLRREVDFLPPGRGKWETFMELYKKLGFPAPVIQLSDIPQAAVFAEKPLDDPAAAKTYAEIWEYVEGYAKARGWPEIIVQPVDEPAWQGEEAKARNLRLLQILKRLAPHVRTEQDGPGDEYFHKLAGPLADVWNYNGGLADRRTIADAQKQGKIICIYNCDVEWYRPEVDRYVAGWFQIVAGINGCFNWAYQSFSGDPYDDRDGSTGDHVAYYPPGHGHPGGPSVAWEAFREGIDDYRYVYLLRQLIEKAGRSRNAPARQLAQRAAGELQDLIDSIKYSPRVRGTARWDKSWSDNSRLYISGALRLPTGWSFADYDQARRKIADYCVRLIDALE